MSINDGVRQNYVHFNLKERLMFSIKYPTTSEYQAYVVRAHRMRAAAVAGLFSDLGRRLTSGIGFGWLSAAAR